MNSMLRWFLAEEDGQGIVVYALIFSIISLLMITVISNIGQEPLEFFEKLDGILGSVS